MPIREYKCHTCDKVIESIEKMNDEPLTICPECGSKEIVRWISKTGYPKFSGNGFYETDYKHKK